jgi:RNA polymerase sigma-70 factor (ECF subfamily)
LPPRPKPDREPQAALESLALGMAASLGAARERISTDPAERPAEKAPAALNKAKTSASNPAKDETEEDADRALVERARKGDNGSFRRLVARYQRRVYSVAYGMLRNHEDAMDVTQESFIKVHRYLANFQGSSSFYTWLYRIVVNVAIDHIRRDKGQSVEYDDGVAQEGEGIEGDGSLLPTILGSNPAKALSRRELLERMQKAIDSLPPYHRAVIVMRELEGLSYKEMAKAMKVSKGTIMSRLHHARHKLQKALAEYVQGNLQAE